MRLVVESPHRVSRRWRPKPEFDDGFHRRHRARRVAADDRDRNRRACSAANAPKRSTHRHARRQPLLEDRMRDALDEPQAQYGDIFTSYMIWKRDQETRMELFSDDPWMQLNEFTRALVVRHIWRALEGSPKGRSSSSICRRTSGRRRSTRRSTITASTRGAEQEPAPGPPARSSSKTAEALFAHQFSASGAKSSSSADEALGQALFVIVARDRIELAPRPDDAVRHRVARERRLARRAEQPGRRTYGSSAASRSASMRVFGARRTRRRCCARSTGSRSSSERRTTTVWLIGIDAGLRIVALRFGDRIGKERRMSAARVEVDAAAVDQVVGRAGRAASRRARRRPSSRPCWSSAGCSATRRPAAA